MRREAEIACIGLRARTARAIAVVVSGTGRSPHAVSRTEISLAKSGTPALFQPYHEVMDLPWDRAAAAAAKAESAIEAVATWIGLGSTRRERQVPEGHAT